jgi:hypothetical protein
MKIRNDTDTRVEAILDDLYTHEISASLLWNKKRRFHATLGSAALAEASFRTSPEAARWLALRRAVDRRQSRRTYGRTKARPIVPALISFSRNRVGF